MMECEETRVDMRKMTGEEMGEMARKAQLIFKINHAMPFTPEYDSLVSELFGDRIGEGSRITAPFNLVASEHLRIGRDVYIGGNMLGMCRGGIDIEDGVMIAANVSLLSNNHDLYDRDVLTCKPVRICKGASILPGVRVGRYAVVGAGSVVTKDVEDYQVAVGNPARPVKTLDRTRFGD
jgi:acetyltransferase-like isoleucine patch superfamily enzyme